MREGEARDKEGQGCCTKGQQTRGNGGSKGRHKSITYNDSTVGESGFENTDKSLSNKR